MGKTSIEWTDYSVNPIRFGRGHFCQKISPGCAACYASRLQPRFGNPEFGGVGSPAPVVIPNGVTNGQYLWLDPTKLREVLNRRKPTRYFWCDMTDLFGSWVPDEFIDRCFATMALTPQHTHQVLTKRPERMAAYLEQVSDERDMQRWENAARDMGHTMVFEGEWVGPEWPLPNVWLGVSVEDQARKGRIDVLRQIPAAVRFLSLEPLLEDLGALDLGGIHWTIIGGESGAGARPCDLAWVRSLVRQCAAAAVPCFVKQLGAAPVQEVVNACHGGRKVERLLTVRDPKGGSPGEWPADLRVREFPGEAAP